MAELILELSTRPGQAPQYRRISEGTLSLGRGFDNELIVPDPHVGAKQFQLSMDADQLYLVILDRTNSTYLNGHYCDDARQLLQIGDTVRLGQLRLRLLSATAPVPPARKFIETRWSSLGPWRAVFAALMLALCCAYALFFDYQETVERINWLELGTSTLLLGLIVLAWSCMWAAVGRVLRHRAQLARQLFASAALTWILMQVTVAAGYLDYASNLTWLAEGFDWVMSALVSVLLLYYNLEMASNLRRPLLVACTLIGLLFFSVFSVEMLQRKEYHGMTTLAPSLKPPFAKLQQGQPLAEKLAELPELFE